MRKALIIILLLPAVCFAQTKGKKLNLHTIASGGLATGEKQTAGLAQLSGGISHGHWFYGLGVGLDYYRYNSIPVFADWRFSFGPKRVLFLYANAGYHFTTDKVDKSDNIFRRPKSLDGGFFGDGGFGFQLPAGRKNYIGLSVGYRYKKVTETYEYSTTPFMACWNCGNWQSYKEQHGLTTIVTKLTWEFGRFANVR